MEAIPQDQIPTLSMPPTATIPVDTEPQRSSLGIDPHILSYKTTSEGTSLWRRDTILDRETKLAQSVVGSELISRPESTAVNPGRPFARRFPPGTVHRVVTNPTSADGRTVAIDSITVHPRNMPSRWLIGNTPVILVVPGTETNIRLRTFDANTDPGTNPGTNPEALTSQDISKQEDISDTRMKEEDESISNATVKQEEE